MSVWPTLTAVPSLSSSRVQVWRAAFTDLMPYFAQLAPLLTVEEQQRAARFKFVHLQQHWTLARAMLRALLATYIGVPAGQVPIAIAEGGKPFVVGEPLQFNLSHSNDWCVVAVHKHAAVGVDVEQHKSCDVLALAKRFFAPAEYEALLVLPESQRVQGFYTLWTQKEAFVKAVGAGIQYGLQQFVMRVTLPAGLLHLHHGDLASWTIEAQKIIDTVDCAVAVHMPEAKCDYATFCPGALHPNA